MSFKYFLALSAQVAVAPEFHRGDHSAADAHTFLLNMIAVSDVLDSLNTAVGISCQASANSIETLSSVKSFKDEVDTFRANANTTKQHVRTFMDGLNVKIRDADTFATRTTEEARTKFRIAGNSTREHSVTSVGRISLTENKLSQLR